MLLDKSIAAQCSRALRALEVSREGSVSQDEIKEVLEGKLCFESDKRDIANSALKAISIIS